MPLPTPKKGEKKEGFIKRCMSDKAMKSEYPDKDQRYAVCESQWKSKRDLEPRFERAIYELRALEPTDDSGYIIEGYAIVYEEKRAVGEWFYEIIKRGALDGADLTDVPLFVHHNNRKIPLARSRRNKGTSTMTLTPDERGLHFRAELDVENNTEAKALYSAVKREDLDNMSFAFSVKEEKWLDLDKDMPTREIIKFNKIFEISAVWSPVYEGTNIQARDGVLESTDKLALESAKSALDNDKNEQQEAEERQQYEIELLRFKAQILSKG